MKRGRKDITIDREATDRHRKEVELEQERVQQLELNDRFLSHASHELRSPLSSVHEFLTLLRDGIGGQLSTEHEEYVEIMLRNVSHLGGAIGDLMEVARARSDQLVVTPRHMRLACFLEGLTPTLEGIVAPHGLRLELRFDSGLPAVLGDPNRIRQVLVNLVERAVRYSPKEGSVAVIGERCPGEPDFVRFTVADQGCGIPLDELDHVFEFMHQVERRPGTVRHCLGLGLYMCRELVTLQGGRIWAERVPGQGATFRFNLPVFSVSEGVSSFLQGRETTLMLVGIDVVPPLGNAAHLDFIAESVWDLARTTLPSPTWMLPRAGLCTGGERILVLTSAPPGEAAKIVDDLDSRVRQLALNSFTEVSMRVWTGGLVRPTGSSEHVPNPYHSILAAIDDAYSCRDCGARA